MLTGIRHILYPLWKNKQYYPLFINYDFFLGRGKSDIFMYSFMLWKQMQLPM